eukprot:CAMPEP_0194750616 /NCGR_PEP_ID=MMETSP0323_2-20130528/4716_1 /TAXON_ID=2866 ORGANISM="Crypthecodinium cohnii, Strain Seligo" /NCGR_SAMPLE_ID=MMETSP0323_2 /ASSEMBLY_ACC=CAM_ASM_000346 /LENGTH=42 /DNA_ID= /DNA_START= /DNA_END= /DNA_ORIENTATION=
MAWGWRENDELLLTNNRVHRGVSGETVILNDGPGWSVEDQRV